MAARQLRISDISEIKKQAGRFLGRKISIVLRDGTALLGVLTRSDENEIEIRNMAQKVQRFPMPSVSEIYIDSID